MCDKSQSTLFIIGVNLFAVSLHEIGHVLGLDHSEKKTSVMAPVYQYDHMKLTDDDILGLHAIYDQKTVNK